VLATETLFVGENSVFRIIKDLSHINPAVQGFVQGTKHSLPSSILRVTVAFLIVEDMLLDHDLPFRTDLS
jgi:hypothetical protein